MAKILNKMQASSVTPPNTQFSQAPKFLLPLPPPKELAPTDNNEKPMDVTTLAATIGATILIQYLANNPKTPSTIPPINTAPTIAG